MTTKAKGNGRKAEAARPEPTPDYEQAVRDYNSALEMLHRGDYAPAGELFSSIAGSHPDEPVLSERARSFARVCARRSDPTVFEPKTAEDLYYQAVLRMNSRDLDEAVSLLDRALGLEPGSARVLYARASAFALNGTADRAVADLRQAIAADARLRFQAANDPDFERIREEPAFIDIIEPTPTGA